MPTPSTDQKVRITIDDAIGHTVDIVTIGELPPDLARRLQAGETAVEAGTDDGSGLYRAELVDQPAS